MPATYITSKIDGRGYCKTNGAFARHLKEHNLTYKDYYEIYETHITPLCHCLKPRKFYQKTLTYADTCGSQRCASKIRNDKRATRTQEQIDAEVQSRKLAWTRRSKSDRAKISKKKEETNLRRYGAKTPAQNTAVKQKINQTNLQKYGRHPSQTDAVKKKIRQTNLQKYGAPTWAQSLLKPETRDILLDPSLLERELENYTVHALSAKLECDLSIIYEYISKYNLKSFLKRSSFEAEVATALDKIGVNYQQNCRSVIPPMELDFYFPEHGLAIECNGDYWHSDIMRPRHYHFDKWKFCADSNIRLIQILHSDWNRSKLKFEKLIHSALNRKSKVMGARKLVIRKITNKRAKQFLDAYHLQSSTAAVHSYGAFDDLMRLRAVMCFGWTRGSKDSRNFELKRWATDNEYSYPGLFSKTFKHAQRELQFDEVVSFSMNDWFTGDVYDKCGFSLDKITTPAYKYLFDSKWQHCSRFTKGNIRKTFYDRSDVITMLDDGATEFQVMDYLKILRTWDSGKKRWVWKRHK